MHFKTITKQLITTWTTPGIG